MSKSHSIVTVAPRRATCCALLCACWFEGNVCLTEVGALFATALVFVTDGKASEAAVEALGRMLEARHEHKAQGIQHQKAHAITCRSGP